MDSIKVSVIVPVYNGESFLKKNLIVLCRQTLKEIEFIFVNDASTDGSAEILTDLKKAYGDKVTVINSDKNNGPGGARNLGIKQARGKYIAFMDQDDYVLEEMYEEMYEEAVSGDYDIVGCGYYNKKDEKYLSPCRIKGSIGIKEKIRLCNDILYIWNKLFKKELIESMSMLFRSNVVNDDVDFCIEAYLRAKSVSYIDKLFYYYSYDRDTLSRPKKSNLNRYLKQTYDLFWAVDKRINALDMAGYKREICYNFAMLYARSMLLALFSKEDFSYEDYFIFDKTVSMLIPDYYNEKGRYDELRFALFNYIEADKEKSYKRLVDFKKKITGK